MDVKVSKYMTQYYRENRYAASADTRQGYRATELMSADQKAIKKALKDLSEYDYEKGDSAELVKKVQAFAETYNLYMESSGELDDASLSSYKSKLKKFAKEHAAMLEEIGVNVQGNGKLKINEESLWKTTRNKVGKLFGESADYGKGLEKLMKKLDNAVRRNGIGQAQGKQEDGELYQAVQDSLHNSQINVSV